MVRGGVHPPGGLGYPPPQERGAGGFFKDPGEVGGGQPPAGDNAMTENMLVGPPLRGGGVPGGGWAAGCRDGHGAYLNPSLLDFLLMLKPQNPQRHQLLIDFEH